MDNSAIPFPVKQTREVERPQPDLDLPAPRIWKPRHLADFLGVSVSWVYKRTESAAEDPIPRVGGVGRLRFDTHALAFQQWMRRNGIGSDHIDVNGGDE